jgi:hypothetical protein
MIPRWACAPILWGVSGPEGCSMSLGHIYGGPTTGLSAADLMSFIQLDTVIAPLCLNGCLLYWPPPSRQIFCRVPTTLTAPDIMADEHHCIIIGTGKSVQSNTVAVNEYIEWFAIIINGCPARAHMLQMRKESSTDQAQVRLANSYACC